MEIDIKLPQIIRVDDYHEFDDYSYKINCLIDRKSIVNKLINNDPDFYSKQLKNKEALDAVCAVEFFFDGSSYVGLIYSPIEFKKYLDFKKDYKIMLEMFLSCLGENEMFNYEENIDEIFDIYNIKIKAKDFIQDYINKKQNKLLLTEVEKELKESSNSKKRKI